VGIPGGVPTDPTIYRFYEIVQIYGSTLKALVQEKFGDDIMSAINFKLDIKKVDDPEGGSCAVITRSICRPSPSERRCGWRRRYSGRRRAPPAGAIA
jgi:hypothetical protein